MSDKSTTHMLRAYEQVAAPTMFLSGFFQTPANNFYTSESVEIDIVRGDEDVAVAIQSIGTGYRYNQEDQFTNKKFKPPVYDEAFPIDSFELLKRMPGQNPFQQPDFRADVITKVMRRMMKLEAKIRRAIELQASQVLQTGLATLNDSDGNAVYSIDYKPKATHFPTSAVAWDAAGATPLADLESLAKVIRSDGLTNPDTLVMSDSNFELLLKNEDVQKRFDTVNYTPGSLLASELRGSGGTFQGAIKIGSYRFELWTYNARYKDPQTGVSTAYVTETSVMMLSSGARLDGTFGAIPNIGQAMGMQSLVPELAPRLSSEAMGMDFSTNVWMTNDGRSLMGSVGTRPLMIPTAIDSFGCLNTGI